MTGDSKGALRRPFVVLPDSCFYHPMGENTEALVISSEA